MLLQPLNDINSPNPFEFIEELSVLWLQLLLFEEESLKGSEDDNEYLGILILVAEHHEQRA